jgi:energy-coupling factor transport system ATP-binding protein
VIEIECRELAHVYRGGVRALDGLELRIRPGERVALIGQNGSGKTTLARHLNGLLRPTEGQVVIGRVDAAQLHVAQLASLVGLTFQNPDRQIFSASVAAEVAFGPRSLGRRGAGLREAVDEALAAVGLEHEATTNPYDLGLSRRKLLAVASVLAMRTPVVVLDEPTTGQDLAGIERIRGVIDGLHRRGRTVIAISHDLHFVAETFERVVLLRDGRVIGDGTPASVFAPDRWPALRSTSLEPTAAARVGERLGLASTPTEASLIGALAGRRRDQ